MLQGGNILETMLLHVLQISFGTCDPSTMDIFGFHVAENRLLPQPVLIISLNFIEVQIGSNHRQRSQSAESELKHALTIETL